MQNNAIAFPPPPAAPTSPASLSFGTRPVDATALVEPGTGGRVVLGYVMLAVLGLVLAASTAGVGLIGLLVAPIVDWFRWKKVRAALRGSGLQVSPQQLPELHRAIAEMSTRLGMKEAPDCYIVESNVANGFAVKLGTRDIMLLTDDVVWGALQGSEPRALGFIVAHELAHIALKHTSTLRTIMRTSVKSLSRVDELSCDNVALALVGDRKVATHGLAMLTVGPQLMAHINDAALLQQAASVTADPQTLKAEKTMTHPLLLRRIDRLQHR